MLTIIIVAITCLISYRAFTDRALFHKLLFNANLIIRRKEWYRFISHGFVHANWEHLIINMFVFFSFGQAVEQYFEMYFGSSFALFLALYFGAIIVSSIYSFFKHKNNIYYNAVGASGAVSAVTFAFVLFDPMSKILLFFIIPIPGIIFAVLYLGYSYYMSKKNIDNIGHDAHFYGAVFGFIFPLILKPQLFQAFIAQIFN